jgi:hypothetical protein
MREEGDESPLPEAGHAGELRRAPALAGGGGRGKPNSPRGRIDRFRADADDWCWGFGIRAELGTTRKLFIQVRCYVGSNNLCVGLRRVALGSAAKMTILTLSTKVHENFVLSPSRKEYTFKFFKKNIFLHWEGDNHYFFTL